MQVLVVEGGVAPGTGSLRLIDMKTANVSTIVAQKSVALSGYTLPAGWSTDGVGTDVMLLFLRSAAISSDGSMAVLTTGTGAGLVRRVDLATGRVTTIAGDTTKTSRQCTAPYQVDATGTNVKFCELSGITLNHDTSLAFVLDQHVAFGAVRQIDLQSGAVSTIAGGGLVYNNLFHDGVGTNAHFKTPKHLVSNSDGSIVYVTDQHRVR